jgi:glycosyltransferase involved in cell wall biosynthesis
VVGNINLMYAPKYYLGQTVGLKCHEDVIDALGIVLSERPDVVGVLAGGPFGRAAGYERRLHARAWEVAGDRIKMPGILSYDEVRGAWPDFDCAVHVPLSENCGGVVEPLLAGVPTIASSVGGLTEVVQPEITGVVVPPRKPKELAAAVLSVLNNLPEQRRKAMLGRSLVQVMFDVARTSAEVHQIYQHILDSGLPRPSEFDPFRFTRERARAGDANGCGICVG